MDSKMINIIIEALGQTIYMVFFSTLFASVLGFIPVSYTHLDVYKRQIMFIASCQQICQRII